MKLYFDLDRKQLVNPPEEAGIVRSVSFIRGDFEPLELHPLRGGVEATGVTDIVAVIKEKPGPTEPSLADCQTWEEVEGESYLTGEINLNGTALNTLIAAKTQLDLLFEITCFQNGNGPITSESVKCTVRNDLWRGTEGTPLAEPDPETWLYQRVAAITRSIAQGPPTGRKQVVGLTLSGACTDDATLSLVLQGALLEANVTVTLGVLLGNTAEEVAAGLAVALSADADVSAAGYIIGSGADFLSVTAPEEAAEDTTLYLSLSLGTSGLGEPEFYESAVGSAPVTPLFIGQRCRYGNSSPFRWFDAATVSPALWEESTPGVIQNRDTDGAEKLFVEDSIIQTETL